MLHVLGPDGIPHQLQRLKPGAPLELYENPRLDLLGWQTGDHPPLPLLVHIHELIHRHHVVIEIRDDDHRSKDDQPNHENTEGKR